MNCISLSAYIFLFKYLSLYLIKHHVLQYFKSLEKIKLLTLKCVQILIFLLFVSFHWKFKFHLLTNKLLHTITLLHIFIKICGLNGFPWVIIYTNNFHDRLYLHSTTDEKRKRGEKNFHHRNLREEKKKRGKRKRDHSCFCQRLNCN